MATSDDGPLVGAAEYWQAQERTFDALESGEYDLVVLRVGYAGGKTLLGSDWIHMVAMQHPGSDNLVMAPDYSKGGPATYKTFLERLPGAETVPAKGGDPEHSPIVDEYNRNEKRLTYINGSVARLGSADKWNRYAGSEFNAIYCDEPAHYDTTDLYDLVEMLTSRQRPSRGRTVCFGPHGRGLRRLLSDHRTAPRRGRGDGPVWADRMKVVVGDSRNNPFLPEDALEKLRRQFEGTEREAQALAGGFAAPTGLVYPTFTRERHVRPSADLREQCGDWRCYGYDHGWDDPRVVLEIGETAGGQLAVLDEFYREGVEYQRAVDWLREHEKPEGRVYAEHEPEHQRAFSRAGYSAEAAEKSLDEGIPAVRRRLEYEDDPEDRPGLLVADACVNTIREFQDYQEDEVGSAGAVDHALDSLRYAIMGVDETEGASVVVHT